MDREHRGDWHEGQDRAAHLLKAAAAVVIGIMAWVTPVADGSETALTVYLGGFFVPLSAVDYFGTRHFTGRLWEATVELGHVISIWGLLVFEPGAAVAIMCGSLAMLVNSALLGGRRGGFQVAAMIAVTSAITQALMASGDRIGAFDLAIFWFTMVFVVVICDGLTRERRAKTEALEAANATLTEIDRDRRSLLDSVSHELRTPTTVAAGFIDLLTQTWDQQDDDGRRAMAETAAEHVGRLERVVNASIEYLDLNNYVMVRESVSLEAAIGAAWASATASTVDRPVRIDVTDGLTAQCDRRALERTLIPLLDNATKFSAPGSAVVVTARRAGDDVVVRVIDHGSGVESTLADDIFGAFEQGPRDLPGTMGLGVGLALARGYAQRNGGDVWLERTGPDGSEFALRVPAVTARATTEPGVRSTPPARRD